MQCRTTKAIKSIVKAMESIKIKKKEIFGGLGIFFLSVIFELIKKDISLKSLGQFLSFAFPASNGSSEP